MCDWIVIGISGVTNGGKTLLAKGLLENLKGNVKIINQDDYFYPEDSPNHVPAPGNISHHNWDVITSINADKLLEDMMQILSSKGHEGSNFLIVEGHVFFEDERIYKLCNLSFFLTLDREECLARRLRRVYDPPDVPGFFEVCVWPMYELYLENIKKRCENVHFIDGKEDPDEILIFVKKKIKEIQFR